MLTKPTVLLFLIAIVFGAAGGVLVYGAFGHAGTATAVLPERVSVAIVTPDQAPTATPTRDPLAIGTWGRFPNGTIVWVDDLGAWAIRRAAANRDSRAESRAITGYQTFEIDGTTNVQITNRRDGMIQVEVVSGEMLGRRGWCIWPSTFVPIHG